MKKTLAFGFAAGDGLRGEGESAPAAAPVPPTPAPTPTEAPAESGPKFKTGDLVHERGESETYTIVGDSVMARCYPVTYPDGSTGMEIEDELEPGEAPMLMNENAPAPQPAASQVDVNAILAKLEASEARALKAEQTLTAMVEKQESAERSAALDRAGIKADLKADYEDIITRAEGQSWDEAVAAHKAKRPSAYASKDAADSKPQSKPTPPAAKLPSGASMPESKALAGGVTEPQSIQAKRASMFQANRTIYQEG